MRAQKKRGPGNTHWGRPQLFHSHPPATPTQFEYLVLQLRLRSEEDILASHDLRLWVRGHMNNRYVPEWLLKAWGMEPSDTAFGLESVRTMAKRNK